MRRLAGLLVVCTAPVLGQAPPVFLTAGQVDTSAGNDGLNLLRKGVGSATRYVVQLDGPRTPARLAAMRAAGLTIGDYLPSNAYVVRVRAANPQRLGELGFIRWVAEYRPEWKLDPAIGRRAALTDDREDLAARGRVALVVTLFPDAPANGANRAIGAIEGATIHWSEVIGGHETLGVEVMLADAPRLATIPQVQFVEEAPEVTLRNGSARWIVASNLAGSVPPHDRGLHGEGQVIGLLDSKVDPAHCAFADTAPVGPLHRKIVAYNAPFGADTHGTHVACSALGDAGADDDTRGMAYAAKLAFGTIPARTQSSITSALERHASQGASVHSNSWGNDATRAYDSLCRGFDAFLHDNEEYVAVVAVSNLGTVRNPENAKNVLSVGATGDEGGQESHCAGGAGPTADGRRKPEVLAPGCGIRSAAARIPCGVIAETGTSMAAPLVAGSAALVRQYFMSGFYPTGAAGLEDAFVPSGALVRAVLVNAAADISGVPGYPTDTEGWGRVLLDDALYFAGDSRGLVVEELPNAGGMATGGGTEFLVSVRSGGEPLRVTLVWTDPPAAPGVSVATVNNLDLEVESPGGVIYRGNAFENGFSVPGGPADAINTVEQVHVAAPQAGTWRVRVKGTAVAVGRQGYALAVSGGVDRAPPFLTIEPAEPLPPLVPPGEPTVIDAVLQERGEAMVQGSALLSYRFGAGVWESTPLIPVGGVRWRGVLPGAACGERPEFYLSVRGEINGPRLSPPDAVINPYSADVGEIEHRVLLDEDFEAGLPPTWLSTGLWHATDRCQPGPPCQGPSFAYYGIDAECNYATGYRTSGVLSAPLVAIPLLRPSGTATLSFCYTLQTEAVAGYDRADVLVNGVVIDEPSETDSWVSHSVDLSAFAGQTVRITFRFDTMDGYINSYRGFQVDGIRVEVTAPRCPPPCYADCDTGTGPGVLDIFDFLCFQNRHVSMDPYACDCDVSGGPGVCDIFDFLCFLNAFGAGCR